MTKSQITNLAFVNNSVYVKTFQRLTKKLLIIVITIMEYLDLVIYCQYIFAKICCLTLS